MGVAQKQNGVCSANETARAAWAPPTRPPWGLQRDATEQQCVPGVYATDAAGAHPQGSRYLVARRHRFNLRQRGQRVVRRLCRRKRKRLQPMKQQQRRGPAAGQRRGASAVLRSNCPGSLSTDVHSILVGHSCVTGDHHAGMFDTTGSGPSQGLKSTIQARGVSQPFYYAQWMSKPWCTSSTMHRRV